MEKKVALSPAIQKIHSQIPMDSAAEISRQSLNLMEKELT